MGLPVGLGLKLASISAKASTFMSTIRAKLLIAALALAAVLFLAHLLVNDFQKHEEALYQSGVAAGTGAERAVWQKASAQNALAQRDNVVQQAKNQSTAVENYLADKASTDTKTQVVKEEIIRYAQSPDADGRCLDDRGVQLLLEGRASSGIGGPTGPNATSPGAVPGAVRPSGPVSVQH